MKEIAKIIAKIICPVLNITVVLNKTSVFSQQPFGTQTTQQYQ